MPSAQVDPGIAEFLYHQYGPGVALVVLVSFGLFWLLRGQHLRETQALLARLHQAQETFQAQLERLTGRYEASIEFTTRRHEASLTALEERFGTLVREQAVTTRSVERSVEALQAAVAGLTVVVTRLVDSQGGLASDDGEN